MLLINTQDDTMHTDAGWQRDLIDALRLESAFNASGLAFPNVDWAAALEPTPADCAHAVANIRNWRSYLPESCVTAMISDGWQWST